jgi:hypothetical protein
VEILMDRLTAPPPSGDAAEAYFNVRMMREELKFFRKETKGLRQMLGILIVVATLQAVMLVALALLASQCTLGV